MRRIIARVAIPVIACVLVVTVPRSLHAQIIPIKTAPVATGDAGLLLPSVRLGMGGHTAALEDSLADPFRSPALGTRYGADLLFVSPVRFGAFGRDVGGQTLILGSRFRVGAWRVSAAGAAQELVPAARYTGWPADFQQPDLSGVTPLTASRRNDFLLLAAARRIPDSPWSVGLGFRSSDLEHSAGSELLDYDVVSMSSRGHTVDYRFGLMRELGDGGLIDITALYRRSRADMTVLRTEWVSYLDEESRLALKSDLVEGTEQQANRTAGFHVRWLRSRARSGWQGAWSMTLNLKRHPGIPMVRMPRIIPFQDDPGWSWGMRLARGWLLRSGNTRFGIEIGVSPMFSHTWAVARETYYDGAGEVLVQAGEHAVDNHFDFLNADLRLGAEWRWNEGGVQVGIQAQRISYHIEQENHTGWISGVQRQGWMEWSPTWGAFLTDVGGMRLVYSGRWLRGTGRPFGRPEGGAREGDSTTGAGDYMVASTFRLAAHEIRTVTHQVSLVIPLGY